MGIFCDFIVYDRGHRISVIRFHQRGLLIGGRGISKYFTTVGAPGIEPGTSFLSGTRSTTEPRTLA